MYDLYKINGGFYKLKSHFLLEICINNNTKIC